MKKTVFLSVLFAGFCLRSDAQVPKKVAKSLVHKVSATWCPPCGTWGWDLFNEIIAATKDKALFISPFPDNSSGWNTNAFYSSTAVTFEKQLAVTGYPSFGANMINNTDPNSSAAGGVKTTGVKNDIIKAVDAFALTTPVASSANAMKISGKDISVEARVEFWSAASGEYYLAAYMIEDKALNAQNGQTTATGTTEHHDVLRGSMSTSAWGEMIGKGSIAAGTKYSKTFTFTVTDTKWDLKKFKIYTVLWKNTGSGYEFVNVSENETATAIPAISGVDDLQLYPNPALGVDASMVLQAQRDMRFNLVITDINGRALYTQQLTAVTGRNEFSLPVAQLPSGIYQVHLNADGNSVTRQLTVRH